MGNGVVHFLWDLMLLCLAHYLQSALQNALHGRGSDGVGGIDAA
jgi:hypothetical protein